MKDDLEGGKNALGEVLLNTLGTAYGLVTMIPEVNDLINALDDSTRDGSLMGSILHDARHAKDLKQQPIRDKIELAGQFSGYESGQAAGEIISEIVSFIGPAKLAKIAGKSKLVSRLSQVPKIEKGLSYLKQACTMLSDNYLSTLARESYGATKDFFRSRLGNLWDDFSYKKFAFAGLDNFRYGEDIGKHTARLYQSTGESAEYQSILRDLYGDASEQSGRKVGREFSKEASEQLSKHSDDVADAVKAVDKTTDTAKVVDKASDAARVVDKVDDVKDANKVNKPLQMHHYATNKSKKYTAEFARIVQRYNLDLDEMWNKELLPHQGRHPNAYHEFVKDKLNFIDGVANGNQEIFLDLYEKEVRSIIRNNPDMLYSNYWKGLD